MPTKNPRLNITFDPQTAAILANLAKHEHRPIASLAKELIIEALERREDKALSIIAETRDVKRKKIVKHDDAWK